jgi:hypothetical protein
MPTDIATKITDAVKSSFNKDGSLIVDELRQKVLQAGKLATGNLYDSITYNTDVYDTLVILEINAADYFKNVNDGRGPGKKFPPIDKILQWVQVRGITPRAGLSGKKQRPLARAQRDLAFVIARAIAKNGILRADLKSGIGPIIDKISGNVTDALNKTTNDILADMAKTSFAKNKIGFTANFK